MPFSVMAHSLIPECSPAYRMHSNNTSFEAGSSVWSLHNMDVGSVPNVSEIYTASSSGAECVGWMNPVFIQVFFRK
jgi:hypothetical protein